MNKRETVAFIFARGGSKGLPGKNLMQLGGVPLIGHSIKTGLACSKIDRVIVSTDDPEIAKVAKSFGAEIPFLRPPELATDEAPEWLSWRHALSFIKNANPDNTISTFISLPCTSPLRSVGDIISCIERFEIGDVDSVIAVSEAQRNPFFNMVKMDKNNRVEIALKHPNHIVRRQDAPEMFDITTIAYVCTPDFIQNSEGLFDGKVGAVIIPRARSIDIDTQLDFDIANYLFRRNEKLKRGHNEQESNA